MITLTIGIPASGKSTWAKQYCADNPNTVRVCRDDFRLMFRNSQLMDNDGESLVTTLVESAIRQAVACDYDIIVDQTNCNERFFRKLIAFCEELDEVQIRAFDIELKEAIYRNSQREAKVPDEVIHKMYDGFLRTVLNVSLLNRPKKVSETYVSDESLPPAIIFDVDGTLALMHDRGPFDWAKVGQDLPNKAVIEAFQAYYDQNYAMIVLSGRDGVCKQETVKWLTDNDIYYTELHMREAKDSRPDTVIKKEIFDLYIRNRFNVVGVYDDRKSVKRMWVNLGLFVFDCNQQDLEF